MRSFLAAVVALIVAITAIGFYRNWFDVKSKNAEGETDIHLKIDKQKIKEDTAAAKKKIKEEADVIREKGKELGHKAAEEAGAIKEKAKDAVGAGKDKSGDPNKTKDTTDTGKDRPR
jgi:hypothetical protein